MKRIVLLAVALVFALALNAQEMEHKIKVGDEIPQFTIKSDVHGTISSEDLKGKVVLVNLFATWCPPCQKELADVKDILWPKYKDNKEFVMLVIGREETDDKLKSYNKKKGFEFPLYPDPKREVFSNFADSTIPRTYLFGKDGKLILGEIGYTKEGFEHLMKEIEKALK